MTVWAGLRAERVEGVATRKGSSRAARGRAFAAVLALAAASPGLASDQTVSEFWPEVNVFVKTGERTRLFLLGSLAHAREFATATEFSYGIHLDAFALPLPQAWAAAMPDMAQRWSLGWRIGYNRIEALGNSGAPDEDRLLADVTLRSEPLWQGLQWGNRSRIEYRNLQGASSWRFRNRLRLERNFATVEALGERVGGWLGAQGVRGVTPYAMVEFFYDGRVSDWNRRYQQYGVELELAEARALEFYIGIQDQQRQRNSYVTALGVVYVVRY
jgi:hypothetical protein